MGRTTGALGVAVVLLAGWTVVRAQSPAPAKPDTPDIMPALLEEVRGLRHALEHMSSAGPRVQLALGRLQLQEQRMNTAVKRVDEVRARLGQLQREQVELQEQVGMMEIAIRDHPRGRVAGGTPGDEPTQEQIEEIRIHQKQRLTSISGEVQRLTAEEVAYSAEAATEQARWTEFNQRLEELERALRPLR
jgi:chromosome segregation ATPase